MYRMNLRFQMLDPHYQGPERRNQSIDLEALISTTIKRTVEEVQAACLNPDEQRWVRLAIEREARRAALARAVIEKSLSGLVWAGLIAGGVALWQEFLRSIGRSS